MKRFYLMDVINIIVTIINCVNLILALLIYDVYFYLIFFGIIYYKIIVTQLRQYKKNDVDLDLK